MMYGAMGLIDALKNVLVGAIIGIFMLLPGASGATMAVVFGIYERLIYDISSIRHHLVKDIKFILMIGIGGIIGILLCAKGLNVFINNYEVPMMIFFGVLIAVQIPIIMKQSEDGIKPTGYNILAFLCGLAIMIAVLIFGLNSGITVSEPGPIVMFFIGALYAICALSPGISGSTLLLALGLFSSVIAAISSMHLSSILPLGIGAIIGALCFARLINHFMTTSRKSTYYAILGLTVGSIVTVVGKALVLAQGQDILILCILFAIAGFIIGLGLNRFSKYYSNS